MLINKKRTFTNTPKGRIYFADLDIKDKEEILKNTKKDWKKLIELHFDAEGGIQANGGVRSWRELSDDYLVFKEESGLLLGILEASTPNLKERYIKSIHYNTKDFRIYMEFPDLVTGTKGRRNKNVTAAVHQPESGSAIISELGQIKRPIIKTGFITSFKNRIIEHFKT